jgi:hypothetical protein
MLSNVTDRLLLDRIRSSDLGQTIAQELEDQRLAERTGWVAELAAARAALERQLPALIEAREKASLALAAKTEELKAAEREYLAAGIAERDARRQADVVISRLENALAQLPEVDDFLGWLSDRYDRWRHTPPSYLRPNGHYALEPAQLKQNAATRAAHERAKSAFSEVRIKAEALRLEALSAQELSVRLAALRADIEEATP